MGELRIDSLTGRSVLVAENRARRPNEFALQSAPATGAQTLTNLALAEVGLPDVPGVPSCPFCVGNESQTPPAVHEQRDADGRWQVRVVPNMYPAVTPGDCPLFLPIGETSQPHDEQEKGTVPFAAPSSGAHEVIIESARHIDRASPLSTEEVQPIVAAYAHRLRHWANDGRFRYGLVFKNQGPRAGASIAHLHSQFIALPEIPPVVHAELHRAEHDYRQHQSCPYCRLIQREREFGQRIVLDAGGYVAFCPFASLQPHEVWLMPDRHEPSFEQPSSPDSTGRLAEILQTLLRRLELTVPDAAYNMLLRTAPWRTGCDNWCHWRLELLPRANPLAGFELATGVHINPLAPETAARQLQSP